MQSSSDRNQSTAFPSCEQVDQQLKRRFQGSIAAKVIGAKKGWVFGGSRGGSARE